MKRSWGVRRESSAVSPVERSVNPTEEVIAREIRELKEREEELARRQREQSQEPDTDTEEEAYKMALKVRGPYLGPCHGLYIQNYAAASMQDSKGNGYSATKDKGFVLAAQAKQLCCATFTTVVYFRTET